MVHFYGIYGVGAVIILVFSRYFNKNNFTLFLGGYAIGSMTEYLISFLVEVILQTKWWDYTNYVLNVNGRVCLLYSIFWGILTIILVKKFNPFLDKIIKCAASKISIKLAKKITVFVIIFLALDCIVTCYAQDIFVTRMAIKHNIQLKDIEKREEAYYKIQNNKWLSNFIDNHWNDEKMIKTFPNIKVEDMNNNIIYLDSLLPTIQPYYKKIFDK